MKSRSLGADDERVHYTCCVSQLNTFRAQLRAQELLLNLQIQAKSLKVLRLAALQRPVAEHH